MKVSFCLTTFNKKELLEITLENYFKYKKDNFELIISDGCSTDGTVEYLRLLAEQGKIDTLLLPQERDNGEWEGFKRTLDYVTGDYVYFLTDDDYFHFPAILNIITWLTANQDVDYLIANGYNLTMTHLEFLDYHRVFKRNNSTKSTVTGLKDGTCGLGLFVKKELTKTLELFSPKYGKRADKTITLELMNSSYKGASSLSPTYVSVKNEKSNSQLYNYDYAYMEKQETLSQEFRKDFTANVELFRQRFQMAENVIETSNHEKEFVVYNG